MTLPALLLATAVLTPSTGPATVPTGIRPPVSVGTPTYPQCGVMALPIDTHQTYAELTGWHDIGDIPPFGTRGMTLTVRRNPGDTIRWGIAHFGDSEPLAEGVATFPPCLNEPPAPRIVVDDTVLIPPVTITAKRDRFWQDVMKRWGAW